MYHQSQYNHYIIKHVLVNQPYLQPIHQNHLHLLKDYGNSKISTDKMGTHLQHPTKHHQTNHYYHTTRYSQHIGQDLQPLNNDLLQINSTSRPVDLHLSWNHQLICLNQPMALFHTSEQRFCLVQLHSKTHILDDNYTPNLQNQIFFQAKQKYLLS